MENTSPLGIKSWAEEDRPREKLILKGKSALSDAELLAIILGSGNDKETAVDLAKRLLHSVQNSLYELGKKDIESLKNFKGIGDAKAISIIATLELGRRRQAENILQKAMVKSPNDAFEILQPHLADLPHEVFMVLLLNRRNELIKKVQISSGGIAGTVVDTKMILKEAILNLCSSIVLAHNHPSGNTSPSQEDKKITQQLKEACKLMEITLYDHIIIGGKNFFSFANEGLL
ncbi:MAG TPA: DNA repair protein RadC [Chitinophagales bacterium]|nr:DNA repair protein RadC [Chitinophagales bacterium]HRP38502.1 DNA repair protein RadC [Chitinophagales bacterium]